MDVAVTQDGPGRYLVACPEQLEWDARVDLVDALRHAAVGQAYQTVILDLHGVKYINSAGLGAIFALRKYTQSAGATLVLARPGATLRRLLETVNLPALMPVAASLDEARQASTGSGNS